MQAPTYADSYIINELHTFFPALLYDPARFRSIQDVFRYTQAQLRARYDVFSNAQRQFQANDPVFQARQVAADNTIRVSVTETLGQVAMNDILLSLMSRSGSLREVLAPLPETRGPPTREQIRAASTLLSQTADSETPCAVCQDSIVNNDFVRKLNGCGHAFHVGCIDTWFQRSSLCPTCRNDITVLPSPAAVAASQAASQPLTQNPLP
jgi:Ring finger domain